MLDPDVIRQQIAEGRFGTEGRDAIVLLDDAVDVILEACDQIEELNNLRWQLIDEIAEVKSPTIETPMQGRTPRWVAKKIIEWRFFGGGWTWIADELNRFDVPTPNGGRWGADKVFGLYKRSHVLIQELLPRLEREKELKDQGEDDAYIADVLSQEFG